eukprot:TRINITY_DN51483_c0_g1_i1.p1 TRINITY_DN51483_c0_g1~~TRINITY_DN51483_c0_g1_i1.p1  ORF type:complete len:496 (+),score=103.89 TRINITY_DN51483_c0_g1_i1:217-1488(+)
MRLWGACADARAWASAFCLRMGVPEDNLALLVDEQEDGTPVDEASRSFPSQKNLEEHLAWLTEGVQPGDFLAFVFCGRGTLVLDGAGQHGGDSETGVDEDDEDDELMAEEGLLCGDFDSIDWLQGRSMRLLTSNMAARYWEWLPKGCSVTLVMDCEHGVSMLPVMRRLDSARLPPSVHLEGEPVPVLEAMTFGVSRSRAEALRELHTSPRPLEVEPHRGDRGSRGTWAKRQWVPGDLFGQTLDSDHSVVSVPPEVQAFAFAAAAPGGQAFEVEAQASKTRRGGRPAARRGLLTQCLLRALQDMNYQGSYYALWWRAVRLLRRLEAGKEQQFQLTFNDGTDPTCREAFEPVGEAEARAYKKRAELDQQKALIDDGSQTHRLTARCCTSQALGSLGPEPPASARLSHGSCGCGTSESDASMCATM